MELVREAAEATAGARNEASLRHELENVLETHCRALGFPWMPFQLEIPVRSPGSPTRFVDVAHGGVVIEYEPPGIFNGKEGAALRHARDQAADYARLLREQEGRDLEQYVLVAWDGAHITFGRFSEGVPEWERLTPFGRTAGERLLSSLGNNGIPLVHPKLLSQMAGPESEHGSALIPMFFRAIQQAAAPRSSTTKTKLLFTEWRRLFGQVVGVQSGQLQGLLEKQGEAHGERYAADPAAYLFALNTYIAVVAKLVAALSLPGSSEDLRDSAVSIAARIDSLESGQLFRAGGVLNMLAGDFFSWYWDDPSWETVGPRLDSLIRALGEVSFDMARKSPESTRDLFKGIYQSFVPRALRHALGEYYTPDWLAAHALDAIGWKPEDSLLDPTCGSGTFLLEALRRRITEGDSSRSAAELLNGLYGIDLNPLAVLAARASLIVSLSSYIDPEQPLNLPVYLADAINPAEAEAGNYRHTLQTEFGPLEFSVPQQLVESGRFFEIFARLRELVDEDWDADRIGQALGREFEEIEGLDGEKREVLKASVAALVRLNQHGWDGGIWCSILAERFAAGNIPRVPFIAGNPPWVKWSHLPPEYAQFIKARCLDLGVFSQDRWVGGIESDISTVITYEVVDKWLAPSGLLAFFITGTVFANESSQGFRRFQLQHRNLHLKVVRVEDFSEVAPFEGVSNFATLLLLERDSPSSYPVPYRMWRPPLEGRTPVRVFASAEDFRRRASFEDLLARPVPGTDAGPWIKGDSSEQALWGQIFAPGNPSYVARKGITPDRNGIFFVEVLASDGRSCTIRNDPSLGRISGIPRIQAVVEAKHVYPLLRGRGVSAFSAIPDPHYRVLLPQQGMHGDPDLPARAPGVHRFLRRFKSELERRSSYRRFQSGQPWWSVWSTGPYTFSPYKVLWREMAGGRFVAAYIGPYTDSKLGRKVVVPDHKLYFVAVESEPEAAFLTAFLNAPLVSRAVSAYAAQLSLGVSVVEYLAIPRFNKENPGHRAMAELAQSLTKQHRTPTPQEENELNKLALSRALRRSRKP